MLVFLALTILLVPLLCATNLYAQDISTQDNKIIVCKLVQYCSNPAAINETPQTDAVSNLSIMVTPNLYKNVVEQDI